MASGWLQKAQSAVFGRREEVPQPYAVQCECGMTYTGIRAAKPQKTACSRCGGSLFIFPVCPYPLPASVEIRLQGQERTTASTKTVEKPAVEKSGKPKKGSKAAANLAESGRQKTAAASSILTEQSLSFGQRLRAVFTPLRIVMIALAATVGGTVALAVRNARYESARREVEPAIERGLKAFGEHDFSTASTELTVAVTALDRLGRTDAASRKVRQRAKEARAAAGLMSTSLADTVADILNEKSDEPLASRVERRMAGQWLFLDTTLLAASSDESRSSSIKLEVDAPLMVGNILCRLEFSQHPGRGWPMPQAEATAHRAIFSAQLESLRVGGGGPDADAVIVLRGSTAVLWTSAEGYAGLIPPPTDEEERKQWEALLEAQRTALDLSEVKVE